MPQVQVKPRPKVAPQDRRVIKTIRFIRDINLEMVQYLKDCAAGKR